jgi:hypothetical protein
VRFSYQDTEALLQRLGELPQRLVLIGGQAVAFWANYYASRIELPGGIVPTSKDVDFLGAAVDVETAARALDGKAFLPTLDDATNSAGYVIFDHAGEEHQLDFMSQRAGSTTPR